MQVDSNIDRRPLFSLPSSLSGIIVLFVLCHMGEMIVSCYEIRQRLAQTEGEGEDGASSGGDIDFPQWVRNLIVVNHILIVANSSLNFAIYCKDLLFRQCAGKVYHKFLQCPQCPTDKNAGKSETFVMGETSRSSDATPLQSPEMTR